MEKHPQFQNKSMFNISNFRQQSRLNIQDIIEKGRERVEHTFTAAAKVQLSDLKHPAGLKATEILPVFPDFEFWPNVYTLAAFDEDPCRRWDNVFYNFFQTFIAKY